jgi:hypothetical protein
MGFQAIDNLTERAYAVPADGVRVMARPIGASFGKDKRVIRIFLGRNFGQKLANFDSADVLIGDDADSDKIALWFREGGAFKITSNKNSRFLTIGYKTVEDLFGVNFVQFDRPDLIISRMPEGGSMVKFAVPTAFFAVDD